MRKALLDVIFASEKRKQALLLLHEGAKEMEDLLKSLGTTRQALLPQIKILEEHYLVSHNKDTYELTPLGKLLVDEMVPLQKTVEVFDIDIDYWGTRNLDFIPPHIFKKLSEIRSCRIIKPDIVNFFEVNQDFIEGSKHSAELFFLFTFMHPSFPPIVSQFIKNDISTTIIVTNELLQKLKKDWQVEVRSFIASGKVKFYLYPSDPGMVSLSVSDSCIDIRLLSKNKEYDNTQVYCCNSQAEQWGKTLFEYYLKHSTPITEI